MQFSEFSSYLSRLEEVSSRLEMTAILAQLYQKLEANEVRQASYLLLGGLTPQYESLEFQLSTKMLLRALAKIHSDLAQKTTQAEQHDLFGQTNTALPTSLVEQEYKKVGDLGLVAQQIMAQATGVSSAAQTSPVAPSTTSPTSVPGTLTITVVYDLLTRIARESGLGSQERKVEQAVQLLRSLDSRSAKYVVRIIIGKMRLGFSVMTLLDALSWSVVGDKSDTKALELAYQKKADIGELAATYLYGNPDKRHERLAQYTVQVGVPVVPALCQRLNSATEIIAKMKEVIVEPKYDGLRVQFHLQKNGHTQIRTFTRNLEETTHMFPELMRVAEQLNCTSCILDGEVIGYDPATDQLLPFQLTVTRKRKHAVEETAAAVPVRLYVYDLLEINGQPLLDISLRKRKELLKDLFTNSEHIQHAPFIVTNNPDELRSFHERSLADGLEGAVIKQVDSQYQSGRKGWSWVKIKEEEGTNGKLSDTLDLVVMGYYAGRGKRAQFGIGAFLVGVLGNAGAVRTIAKIGTGLSDEQFRELKARCDVLTTATKPAQYEVHKALVPDVWTRPALVVEIAADEITKSPVHSAGVALRFPRLVKFRDDKSVDDATTVAELSGITIAR